MEALPIKIPADVLGFVGHTLGFWPKESLVCITPDQKNMVGATLRVDLPKTHGGHFAHAQSVAGCIPNDAMPQRSSFRLHLLPRRRTSSPPLSPWWFSNMAQETRCVEPRRPASRRRRRFP